MPDHSLYQSGDKGMINEEVTYKKFGYYSTDLPPQSGKKVVAVCDKCGKIRALKKHDYRAFCPSCARKRKKVKCICQTCNKTFYVHPSYANLGHGQFCSNKCAHKARSKIRGEHHFNWKGGYVKHKCLVCDIAFFVPPSGSKRGQGKYCSRKCMGIAHSKNMRGENNPSWKDGASTKTYCSKWNEHFREYIRNKYNRKCFLCGKTEEDNGKRLSVHHVNGNKKCGCDADMTCQFVPLCASCHAKVHSNKVDWAHRITNKMKCELKGWYI